MTTPAGIAIVFPGQGSQRTGMARDFHDAFASARAVFHEASDALDLDVAALCFDADPRLDLTEFTQPAIVTAEIAMVRALASDLGLRATHFGGHSLGEYTALCAAGALPLAETVKLVRRRGALMQAAVPAGEGAMSAIIAPDIADIDLAPALADLDVDVANRNAPDQLVVSGSAAGVARATRRVADLLAGSEPRIVALHVSAPFHSQLMRAIEEPFRAALTEASAHIDARRAATVTSNFTGGFHTGQLEPLIDALTRQISGTVDWIANMDALAGAADTIYEVGPSRPLRRFFKTAGRDVTSILSVRAARKALE